MILKNSALNTKYNVQLHRFGSQIDQNSSLTFEDSQTNITNSLEDIQSIYDSQLAPIVLITDGIEACDGDPCAISRALMKNGIFLKPFIIGLGVAEQYKRDFYCIGNFYDVEDEKDFRTVLGLVLEEAINSTTVQVNLLDVDGEPLETNVNMSLYDSNSGKIKYNFIHTMNFKGIPDTLSIDPSVKYKIVVHTLPKVETDEIELIYSLKSDVLCLALKTLKTTSADVILEPSENLTSSLNVKIQVLGSVVFHLVAKAG